MTALEHKRFAPGIWGWDETVQQAYFQAFIALSGVRMSILLLDGRRVGMVNWSLPDAHTLEIENICFLPEYRSQGLGTTVLKKIISDSGTPVISLRVFKDNPAVHLYLRLGFKPVSETEHHYLLTRLQAPPAPPQDGGLSPLPIPPAQHKRSCFPCPN